MFSIDMRGPFQLIPRSHDDPSAVRDSALVNRRYVCWTLSNASEAISVTPLQFNSVFHICSPCLPNSPNSSGSDSGRGYD
jgi:hypothetical protein